MLLQDVHEMYGAVLGNKLPADGDGKRQDCGETPVSDTEHDKNKSTEKGRKAKVLEPKSPKTWNRNLRIQV